VGVLAAVSYGAVAQAVEMPIVNPDELRYTLAAQGVVDGDWLNLRGHTYGYGPVYPLILALRRPARRHHQLRRRTQPRNPHRERRMAAAG
jgi:hypothetical protein